MTLVSTIITLGYRESNFVGQASELTAEEQTEGLALLQSLVDSFFPAILDLKPTPWWIPEPHNTADSFVRHPSQAPRSNNFLAKNDNYPPEGSRVMLRNTSAMTINMQAQPQDGAWMQFVDCGFTADVTISGNGNFIGDDTTGVATSVVLGSTIGANTRVPTRSYLYRADVATWLRLEDLVYAGEFPFPSMWDDYWITALAMRLSPRFGNEPRQITFARYKDMVTSMRGWYRQSKEVIVGDVGHASQNYNNRLGNVDPNTGGW